MRKMLEGLKVIDMTVATAGPGCTKILAEWGCHVIHIERPNESGLAGRKIDNEFKNLNKRSLAVDVKSPEGLELIYKLVEEADFFVTNYRPKAIENMKVDYETIKRIKPDIIYGLLTGFGDEGPDADDPGYDTVAYWARSGMMIDLPEKDSGPIVPPSCVGDITAAIDLVAGLLAAYINKINTGVGEKVMVSLLSHGLYANFDAIRKTQFDIEYPMSRKEPNKPLINTFQTKDKEWIVMTLLKDSLLPPLFKICGREDLVNKPGYSTYDEVNIRSKEIVQIIDEGFAQHDREELLQLLANAGIASNAILHSKDTYHDPQVLAMNYVFEHTYHNGKVGIFPRSPIQFGNTDLPEHKNAPLLGEHTREIMEELNYSFEVIEEYMERGIVCDVIPGSYKDYFSENMK